MSEPKTFASLSSGLLARKGMAKPAMRPQGFGQAASPVDDLGWNDMGHVPAPAAPASPPAFLKAVEHVPSPIAALTPMGGERNEEEEVAELPVVEQQRAAIEASFAAPEPAAPAAKPGAKASAKVKAAFTLRLEAERHLKLRLACAVTGRSAQQLVTEALDQLLKSKPEVEALAGQLPGRA